MNQQLPPIPATSIEESSPALALPFEYNAAVAFVDKALQDGRKDRIAIRTAKRNWTYADLADGVNRFGKTLRTLGEDMEQRIALFLYDSPEFACSFLGAINIGTVPIPTNTNLRPQDYLNILNDNRARALVVEADIWELLSPLRAELTFLRHVITVQHDADVQIADDTLGYAALMVDAQTTLEPAPTTRGDVAFWLYSSDSTGFPKGCVHLHHDMHVSVELYARQLITHPSVLEAGVVGRDEGDGLIKPQAFVVLKEGIELTETLADALKLHVKASLLPVKYPRWTEFLPDLPKTATGKIQRYRLRELVARQAESDLEGRTSDESSQG